MDDPTQVHQVVMNLATNAVQAMPSGGTLRVSLEQTNLDVPRAAIGAIAKGRLSLLDCGRGNWDRAGDSRSNLRPLLHDKGSECGTGLGLSLVHGIVGEVGGAIDVTTGAERGYDLYGISSSQR
jgi:signal transduction histidine kinase